MFNATFAALCLITFCRLDAHGLEAVGQRLDPDRAVIKCRVVEGDPWWRKFSGLKAAAAEERPDAVPVMDPFHVVRLAGDALDRCRQCVQQDTLGHRGRVGDPL